MTSFVLAFESKDSHPIPLPEYRAKGPERMPDSVTFFQSSTGVGKIHSALRPVIIRFSSNDHPAYRLENGQPDTSLPGAPSGENELTGTPPSRAIIAESSLSMSAL